MVAEEFIAAKRAHWNRLDTLLNRARRGRLRSLSAVELTELGNLYRIATSDLAVARRDFPNHPVVGIVNNLVGRAHGEIYRTEATSWRRLLTFASTTFPVTWRASLPWTLVSFACFAGPAIASFLWIVLFNRHSLAGQAELPPQLALLFPDAGQLAALIRQHSEWWQAINSSGRGANATLIMSNNIVVTLKAFAGGILLGVGTIYAMVVNGLLLGITAGLSQVAGFAPRLWSFVAPHAPLELSVIFFGGGAGLQLGWAILHPGLLDRGTALRIAGNRAVIIVLGSVPLLAIAGTIEAWISPSALPLWLKLSVALMTAIALYTYLLGAGRTKKVK
ncbi:MAG: stage II sporulation protein M [Herpetosiphon sp.]